MANAGGLTPCAACGSDVVVGDASCANCGALQPGATGPTSRQSGPLGNQPALDRPWGSLPSVPVPRTAASPTAAVPHAAPVDHTLRNTIAIVIGVVGLVAIIAGLLSFRDNERPDYTKPKDDPEIVIPSVSIPGVGTRPPSTTLPEGVTRENQAADPASGLRWTMPGPWELDPAIYSVIPTDGPAFTPTGPKGAKVVTYGLIRADMLGTVYVWEPSAAANGDSPNIALKELQRLLGTPGSAVRPYAKKLKMAGQETVALDLSGNRKDVPLPSYAAAAVVKKSLVVVVVTTLNQNGRPKAPEFERIVTSFRI